MQDAFDVAVIGGGIVGRLTAWNLAKSDKSTLLLEQHSLNIFQGSSRGNSRMFGEAHLEDVDFLLARHSRYLWQDLERETGKKLLCLNGGLDIAANANSRSSIKEITSKLRSRRCLFEIFDGATLRRRYPQWRCNPNVRAIYSPNEGVLRSDYCMDAALVAAKKHKAFIRDHSRVTGIESGRSGTILIKISSGETYRTQKLVITAGPWAPNILKRFGVKLPLRIFQVQTVYFALRRNSELFTPQNFPVWEWEGEQFVYGFPIFEREGVKASFHNDGRYLKNVGEFRRTPSISLIKKLRLFMNKHLPDAAGEGFEATTCLYTDTPDGDFVIDTVPGFPQIAYFTGCNGSAFHRAPALGKTLTELVCEGKTAIDVSRFSAKRFL